MRQIHARAAPVLLASDGGRSENGTYRMEGRLLPCRTNARIAACLLVFTSFATLRTCRGPVLRRLQASACSKTAQRTRAGPLPAGYAHGVLLCAGAVCSQARPPRPAVCRQASAARQCREPIVGRLLDGANGAVLAAQA
jgi:hypothetical protein